MVLNTPILCLIGHQIIDISPIFIAMDVTGVPESRGFPTSKNCIGCSCEPGGHGIYGVIRRSGGLCMSQILRGGTPRVLGQPLHNPFFISFYSGVFRS